MRWKVMSSSSILSFPLPHFLSADQKQQQPLLSPSKWASKRDIREKTKRNSYRVVNFTSKYIWIHTNNRNSQEKQRKQHQQGKARKDRDRKQGKGRCHERKKKNAQMAFYSYCWYLWGRWDWCTLELLFLPWISITEATLAQQISSSS